MLLFLIILILVAYIYSAYWQIAKTVLIRFTGFIKQLAILAKKTKTQLIVSYVSIKTGTVITVASEETVTIKINTLADEI
jgi:hypothetical protein